MFTTGACSKNERGIYLQCDRSADEQGSGGKAAPVATLKYLYRKDGMIAGRVVDGKYQMYTYDKRGQLLQVADMQGNVAEKYVYDPAGNILSKTIAGKTTSYTYDKANQLVSSVYDGKTTHYEYDAAGRLIKEDDKSYAYGWLDKVLAVRENDKKIASFDYQVDGQIAQSIHGDQSEAFFWDGLALIHRGETSFINEPYVTGGNPILSSEQGVMFTDMLGSTLNIGGKAIHMTAFGESSDTNAMFTGKPYIGELGYAFLFRNYRADQGKWQTTDPLGYPDGWNNLAYVNNEITRFADMYGGYKICHITVTGMLGSILAFDYGSFTFSLEETPEGYYYHIYSSWWADYAFIPDQSSYTCSCPDCNHSFSNLTYRRFAPQTEYILFTEVLIPEDQLLRTLHQHQEKFKEIMHADMEDNIGQIRTRIIAVECNE